MRSNKPVIWSNGGGVQSMAIAVLIRKGILPKPERSIIANTDREKSSTWRYMIEYMAPVLDDAGCHIEIAPHSLATVDLFAHNGDLLIPAYVNDAKGKMPTFCSNEWKKRVVNRYINSAGYGPNNPVTMWYGFSLDEYQRMKKPEINWIMPEYPLIFMQRLRRHECLQLVEDFGLPTPPRSACWMCPQLRDDFFYMQRDEPDDFAKSVALEKSIRAMPRYSNVTLHYSGIPLDEIKFSEVKRQDLFGECADVCWT